MSIDFLANHSFMSVIVLTLEIDWVSKHYHIVMIGVFLLHLGRLRFFSYFWLFVKFCW